MPGKTALSALPGTVAALAAARVVLGQRPCPREQWGPYGCLSQPGSTPRSAAENAPLSPPRKLVADCCSNRPKTQSRTLDWRGAGTTRRPLVREGSSVDVWFARKAESVPLGRKQQRACCLPAVRWNSAPLSQAESLGGRWASGAGICESGWRTAANWAVDAGLCRG